jgi:hypothetical protein
MNWTVTFSYLGYAAALIVGALCWFGALAQTLIYRRIEVGLLEPAWREVGFWLARNLRYAVAAGLVCALLAFVAAVLPAAESTPAAQSQLAQAHKAYQLRFGAIALCFLGLVYLSGGRMGEFDAEIAAVAVFGWAVWCLVLGWLAFAGAAPVAGPAVWWLALIVDLLALAAFAAIMLLFSRSSRLF